MPRHAAFFLLFLAPSWAYAQPTYKLGVGSHLFPLAEIKLDGTKLTRSAVKDDPGFRLQFHFLKDGKTLQTIEARAHESVTLPDKGPGNYAVVLELFYPAYKPGKEQKGQFKAISNFLTYHFDTGKVKLLEQTPALIIPCGTKDDEKIEKGYAYKLVQGAPVEMKTGSKTHAWTDAKMVRVELSVPPETPGLVRLFLLDGDNLGRKQQVTIQGRPVPPVDGFAGAGKTITLPLGPAETKMGKIDITITNLQPMGTAVVSTIEFVPALHR